MSEDPHEALRPMVAHLFTDPEQVEPGTDPPVGGDPTPDPTDLRGFVRALFTDNQH